MGDPSEGRSTTGPMRPQSTVAPFSAALGQPWKEYNQLKMREVQGPSQNETQEGAGLVNVEKELKQATLLEKDGYQASLLDM